VSSGLVSSRRGLVHARTRLDRVADAFQPAAVRAFARRVRRRFGITRIGGIALLGALIVWVLARVVAGTAMYVVAYGIVVVIILSFSMSRRRIPLTGERAGLFPRVNEGEQLDVTITLTARRGISTVIIEEKVAERLGQPVRIHVPRLPKGSDMTHSYPLRCSRRGVYEVGPLVALTGDPLGLSQRETVIAEKFELLVHPRVDVVSDRPLTRAFEEPPMRPPVSKPWPHGMEFYGMREYGFGDDLRRVVWRAAARTGKLMVREAEQGITDQITIILNTDRGTHSRDGEGVSESFEAGVRAAASLGAKHLKDGFQVRLLANAAPLTGQLHGPTSRLALLDALARVDLGREPLADALVQQISSKRNDTHIALITPNLSRAEAAQLGMLARRGISILVVALVWSDEHAETIATAAGVGCEVVGIHPGEELADAFHLGGARRGVVRR